MRNSSISIQVEHLTKHFLIPHERRDSLREHFVHLFSKVRYEQFTPLKDVTFTVHKGEFVGIIGSNGSGKSTLLKLLAGIYLPDEGHIQVHGSIATLLELGTGFHPELTARENVYLNGLLMGLPKKKIRNKFEEVVSYAGVERFVDQKLKNYSSGMLVRLAFAVAIQSEFDILLLDEVLAVGDLEFQQKSSEYFKTIKRDASKTIVLVTHDLNIVKKYCTTVYLLERGALVWGENEKVIQHYERKSLS